MIYHNILENDRIRLRALEPSDVALLYKWENDTSNWLVSATQIPYSMDVLESYIEHADQDIYSAKQIRLIIDAKDLKNKAVGAVDLFDFDPNNRRAGIGILIDSKYRRLHYGNDALERIIEYSGNVLNVHQLYANILSENKESLALFQQQGFKMIGVKKQWIRSP